jgi:capsular exopolysaccharide synthesis family protein
MKAEAREAALYDVYEKKLQTVLKLNVQAAEYGKLAADLQTKQEFSKVLDDRIKVLEVAQNADQIINDVEIIEPAAAPDSPSFPKPKRTLAAATVAGALLGIGLALLRDRRDGRMHSVEEIQTVVGLPILGVVPAMSGRRTAVARAMTVHLDPRSVVAESYRTIRTAVYFGTNGSRAKTLLISSPEPGDGKTTSASNLAIAIAQTGRSVLLLDADFRKPTQHKNLDVKDSVGLSSVLAGRETLERAIQRTGVEGLDILPCGPIPANPSEILNSREFGELIDSLAMRYDHILFDSPPVNAVTDARILGAVCDATILVLRADKSTRKSGEHARNALMAVGAKVLGAIVNDAPNRKGYEVYGGSYYGNADVSQRQDGGRDSGRARKRLANPLSDIAD